MQEGVPEETRRLSNELCSVWKDGRYEEERSSNSINFWGMKRKEIGDLQYMQKASLTPAENI